MGTINYVETQLLAPDLLLGGPISIVPSYIQVITSLVQSDLFTPKKESPPSNDGIINIGYLEEEALREQIRENWKWYHWFFPKKVRLRFTDPTPTVWEQDLGYWPERPEPVVLTPSTRQQSLTFAPYNGQNNRAHLNTAPACSSNNSVQNRVNNRALQPTIARLDTTLPRFHQRSSSPQPLPLPTPPTFWQSIGIILSSFSLFGSCRSHRAVNAENPALQTSQVSPITFDPS